MENCILKTTEISKKYKDIYLLRNVNMTIKKGDIYGFIGKNGAGKTTLIKIICGLVNKSGGEIALFGNHERGALRENRKRLGTLIEQAAFFGDMTAYENMELTRRQRGIPGKKCIVEKLRLVGLNPLEEKKVSRYSLGMKQRLGIAMALLGDPEFLILDEPINGLDPMGVAQVREILKKLNKDHGTTILISSHLLSELHQLATCYGIINDGQLIEEISSKELDEKCKKALEVKVNDAKMASLVLENNLGISKFKVLPNNLIKVYDYLDKVEEISKAFIEEGISVYEISIKGDDLERYFLNLVGGSDND